MAKLFFRHPEVRAERASKDAAEALGLSPYPKSGLPDFGTLTTKSATADLAGPLRGHLGVTAMHLN
jgi:hypothetical protein